MAEIARLICELSFTFFLYPCQCPPAASVWQKHLYLELHYLPLSSTLLSPPMQPPQQLGIGGLERRLSTTSKTFCAMARALFV